MSLCRTLKKRYLLLVPLIISSSYFAQTNAGSLSSLNQKKSVIIIGAGAAGVFTAYELNKQFPGKYTIHVFEAKPEIGGHVSRTTVNYGGKNYVIDTGAQFFSAKSEPHYMQLVNEIGLSHQVVNYPGGMAVWDKATGQRIFWLPAEVSDFSKYTLQDWGNLVQFATFIAYAYRLNYIGTPDWTMSLHDWLSTLPVTDYFRETILKNVLYQFVTPLSYTNIGYASAVFATTYFMHQIFGGETDQAHINALNIPTFEVSQSLIGLYGILKKALDLSGATVTTKAAVTAITQEGNHGLNVTVNGDTHYHADYVVFATSPGVAHTILKTNTQVAPALLTLLKHLSGQYQRSTISIQKDDPCWLPHKDPKQWEVANVVADTQHKTDSLNIWFGPLRPTYGNNEKIPVFKTWGTPDIMPSQCSTSAVRHGRPKAEADSPR